MDQENTKTKFRFERLQKLFENFESYLMMVMFGITVAIISIFGLMNCYCHINSDTTTDSSLLLEKNTDVSQL